MTRFAVGRMWEPVAITASLLGVTLLFLAATLRLTPAARIVPISVLVPLLLLLGYVLWRNVKSLPSRTAPPATTDPPSDRWLLGWILTLPTLVTAAGVIAGSALFVTLWLRRRSNERWLVSIGSGLATALVLWFLGATVIAGLPRGGLLYAWLAAAR